MERASWGVMWGKGKLSTINPMGGGRIRSNGDLLKYAGLHPHHAKSTGEVYFEGDRPNDVQGRLALAHRWTLPLPPGQPTPGKL